jgi:hypothetical protein
MLEVCAHTAVNDIPPEYRLLRVEAPKTKVDFIAPESLPGDWQVQSDTTRIRPVLNEIRGHWPI